MEIVVARELLFVISIDLLSLQSVREVELRDEASEELECLLWIATVGEGELLPQLNG